MCQWVLSRFYLLRAVGNCVASAQSKYNSDPYDFLTQKPGYGKPLVQCTCNHVRVDSKVCLLCAYVGVSCSWSSIQYLPLFLTYICYETKTVVPPVSPSLRLSVAASWSLPTRCYPGKTNSMGKRRLTACNLHFGDCSCISHPPGVSSQLQRARTASRTSCACVSVGSANA